MIRSICRFQLCKFTSRKRLKNAWIVYCFQLYYAFLLVILTKRLPFNWKTTSGYLIAYVGQVVVSFCTVYLSSPVLSFIIGSCWLFGAFINDIKNDLIAFNGIESTNTNQVEIKKQFCQIVQLYSDVKQLSETNKKIPKNSPFLSILRATFDVYFVYRLIAKYNTIYEFITIAFFIWGLLTMSSTMLVIQTVIVKYKIINRFMFDLQ